MSIATADDKVVETVVMRRVFWRLMPFLLAAYLVCYIDRVNVGFASLQMNRAVGIDPKTYGLGAGIFFIGYFILEVPSNLGLERFGARRWIARIMVSWGIISGCFALIGGPTSFLILRFLLGAAEAGFFPGVILYLTYWFPSEHRARIVGIFMVAIPVAGLTGSPISGAILYGRRHRAWWLAVGVHPGSLASGGAGPAEHLLVDRPPRARDVAHAGSA